MAKKNKKKTSNQLKALRELHNIVTSWTDKDFEEKGPFSDYCYTQRKKNKWSNSTTSRVSKESKCRWNIHKRRRI